MSLGMSFMHHSLECSIAFGYADHLARRAVTLLSPLPQCLSIALVDNSLVDMFCISLAQANVYRWYEEHFPIPQVYQTARANRNNATVNWPLRLLLPSSHLGPSIGAHSAIVTREMEQLNWRALGLLECVTIYCCSLDGLLFPKR